jgi:hypothetical protein
MLFDKIKIESDLLVFIVWTMDCSGANLKVELRKY